MFGFVGLILVVVLLVHLYLWKRLVKDTLRPGRGRLIGSVVAALLAVLIPVTLVATRSGHLLWLAWGGALLALSLAGVGSSWPGLRFWAAVTSAICISPIIAHYAGGSRAAAPPQMRTAELRLLA